MVKLIVNGEARNYDGDTDMPLLWVLREDLRLTGTKFGCGIGVCGACTVHIDGVPVRSCTMAVDKAAGKQIRTIEGLSPDGQHPLQRAWVERNVPQCGYCQSGQLMSAAALLEKNPAPSEADINRAMSGNLCRCGTYQRIREAIQLAAAQMSASSKEEA
jgi:aerobic-type carbon monoxide dehydrogenase small subunit (CoxS/CutS family)